MERLRWANLAATAVLTGAAGNAAVSTINNRGNLSAVYKDVTSSDAVKGYAVAGVTAGLTAGLYDGWTGTETTNSSAGNAVGANTPLSNSGTVSVAGAGSGLSTWSGVGRFAANQALQNTTSAALSKLVGQDGSFSDALQSTLANTFMAAGFNWIGDVTQPDGKFEMKDGTLAKAGLHAVMGGLAAEAMGGDFKTGALAAGVNELLVEKLAGQYGKMPLDEKQSLLVMNSQLIGVMTAGLQGGDVKDLQIASAVAGSATNYNRGLHDEEKEAISEELARGDFESERLNRAACYEVSCWALYPRNSADYRANYVSDEEILTLSNELAWVEAQQDKGLFMYSAWDGTKDFMNTDGIPIGKYATQLVGGGVGVYSGVTLCTGTAGLGCALGGGSLTVFGAGNITEATTGVYAHFSGSASAINPVKKAFDIVPGGYGPVVYSGMDLATAVGVGFVKVPLLMGTADGLNRPKTMFDVMVPKMDNNYFIPKAYIPTPYGTAGAIYLLGVGGKGYELGDKIYEGPKDEN